MQTNYANHKLLLWSEWLLKKDLGCNGYPKKATYTNLIQIRGTINGGADFDNDALEVDRFMTKLLASDKLTFDCISLCYNIAWQQKDNGIRKAVYSRLNNQTSVATHFKLSQSTVSYKLGKVHRDLLDYLLDR
jgi:hypothetical protein